MSNREVVPALTTGRTVGVRRLLEIIDPGHIYSLGELDSRLLVGTLEGVVVRLYGLRIWVEQSYKQVKTTLGWAQYQVRSSRAIQRHWVLIYCAFTFCWWQTVQPASSEDWVGDPALALVTSHSAVQVKGEKSLAATLASPARSWPSALRQVRSWLEPAIMLKRYWRAYSPAPPPPALQELLERLWRGTGINVYVTA